MAEHRLRRKRFFAKADAEPSRPSVIRVAEPQTISGIPETDERVHGTATARIIISVAVVHRITRRAREFRGLIEERAVGIVAEFLDTLSVCGQTRDAPDLRQ